MSLLLSRTLRAAAAVAGQRAVLRHNALPAVEAPVLVLARCMAGHSKWANIKHAKAAEDAKRAKLFARLARDITRAVRQAGADVDGNPALASAISVARQNSMPKANIQSAIKVGEGNSEEASTYLFEGTGPAGVHFLVEAVGTCRLNAIPDIKRVFNKHAVTMGKDGSSTWVFDRRGIIDVAKDALEKAKVDVEELALNVDADEVENREDRDTIRLFCTPEKLHVVAEAVEKQSLTPTYVGVEFLPNEDKAANLNDLQMATIATVVNKLEEVDCVENVVVNVIDFDLYLQSTKE